MANGIKAADRAKFGISGQPIKVKAAYVKGMSHDSNDKNVSTQTWMCLLTDGRRVHVNTYNGNVGKRIDLNNCIQPALDEKAMTKKLKGYNQVTECPFAEIIGGEAPAAETPAETPAEEPATV